MRLATEARHGEVRPFERADVTAVATLWRRCFPREPATVDSLVRTIADIFVDSPWGQADLPSLVYTEVGGQVTGFVGVIPRPMVLHGAPLRAVTTTRLMVEPHRRGIAALRLLQALLAGPQDLAVADFASAPSRTLWERLGGVTAIHYSLEWFRPLAPARAALGWWAHVARSPVMKIAAESVGRLVDLPLTRLPISPFRRRVAAERDEELSEAELLRRLEMESPGPGLRASYRPDSLRWLLGMLRRKLVGLRIRGVRDGGAVIGSYAYGLDGDIGQVVHLDWTPGRFDDVYRRLLADAFREGAAAVSGRLSPPLLRELDDRLCILRRSPWVLVHSPSRAVLDAIARGDARLGRMDGEWWIPA